VVLSMVRVGIELGVWQQDPEIPGYADRYQDNYGSSNDSYYGAEETSAEKLLCPSVDIGARGIQRAKTGPGN